MKRILFLCLCLSSIITFSQEKKKIIIENAEIQYADEEKTPGATILLGNVRIKHDGINLTCQQALFYKKENFFKAIGNVLIKQGDTITQTSDYADYDANAKQALSWGNVVLKDPTMTLTTDTLQFDRINQKLYYQDYATIRDVTNTLKSKNGNYYLENKKFTATTRVTVVNPEHNLASNHLDYYTNSGLAYLYGPSTITNTQNENRLYSERGFYNTKTDISYFTKNAKLFLKERTVEGDSLYYDKNKGFASATNNIKVIDTVQNFISKGNYAELFEKKDSLFIIKRAVAISIIDKDSMFIHGDTLLVTGKPKKRVIRTYHNVKIYKSDLQGKCDSIYTNQETGYTKMYRSPVIWSDQNQITGDSIYLQSNVETEKLDSLKVFNNAFIVSKDSLAKEDYNQIKGRNMFGKFDANKLKFLLVKGNAESIYFNRNAETQVLETITKEVSSNIEFTLDKGQIQSIKYLKSSDGKTYPPSELDLEGRKIKGFIWREDEQPKSKNDIFIKDGNENKAPLKKKALEKPSLFIDEKTKDKKKGKKKTAISIIGQ
ncbi:OstA-like protein [Polaribacter dokdonensis]|uniref:OstA family protein n=1 Tax=Polaribacter dokdonensis DSW-5 TaxID=1300348 RepID=A0A0M9CIE2_9FLAO|nr:OstA-like protein [Polaribacter dokdonensis]KOY52605.1 OstA family protein [Polaribacter dokdonensis DSW-5]SEE48826.1 OstA-like protein [Polaribacter dokdonensis DSW-5]